METDIDVYFVPAIVMFGLIQEPSLSPNSQSLKLSCHDHRKK